MKVGSKLSLVKKVGSKLSLVKTATEISMCCDAQIDSSLSDGIIVGSCAKCGRNILRVNPRTGKQEYLNGESPYSQQDAIR